MKKLRLFIENFLVYGVGGIVGKAVHFIMVPIVTRLMPDSTYYGTSDLCNIIISLGRTLAVMGMYDAMYRMFFEKEDEEFKKEICSTTFFFTMAVSCMVAFIVILWKGQLAEFILGDVSLNNLIFIVAIAIAVGATNNIVSAPTRMQNKRKVYLIMNTVSPVLAYSIAIPLLLKGFYMMALPLASLIAGLTTEVAFYILNKKWFKFGKVRWTYLKNMLFFAFPLVFESIVYWVFSSCDRIMISNIMGVGANGIYAVGSKLGYASQLIYSAFAGGWQYFAFSTMKEKNQVHSNSKIFEYLGIISFVSSMFIFAFSKFIYEILFEGEYVEGYIVAPYLYLAPLLLMLYQTAGNQLLVIKKTWPSMLIISGGAVVNIGLNLYLIPKMGIEGAAIATLLGYIVAVTVCVIVLYHMKLIILSKRFVISVGIVVTYILMWRLVTVNNVILSVMLATVASFMCVFLYKKDLRQFMLMLGGTGKNRHGE